MVRHARGSSPDVRDVSQGPAGSRTIDDLRRTLTQVFGDGEGAYPDDAYLDVFFIHTLTTLAEVDAIYQGVQDPDPNAERIGALAALRHSGPQRLSQSTASFVDLRFVEAGNG